MGMKLVDERVQTKARAETKPGDILVDILAGTSGTVVMVTGPGNGSDTFEGVVLVSDCRVWKPGSASETWNRHSFTHVDATLTIKDKPC